MPNGNGTEEFVEEVGEEIEEEVKEFEKVAIGQFTRGTGLF